MTYLKRYLLVCYIACMSCGAYSQEEAITVPVSEKGERRIVVVTASYNNQRYYELNLESVFNQQYENYHIVYINDCSADNTLALVQTYIHKRGMQDRVTVISNTARMGALANHYHAIHTYCNDTDIVVILDGDDWLLGTDVFPYLNSVYQDSNVWMTYGQFQVWPTSSQGWCCNYPNHVVQQNAFRSFQHNPSHLRTFYAGLFKQIKREDLMYGKDFFAMCADNAVMFPMIEMARKGHFKFLSKVMLVWNGENVLNDHKQVKGLQNKIDRIIRTLPRYDAIETPFLNKGHEE